MAATNGGREVAGGAREVARDVRGRVSDSMAELRGYAESADGALREFARERPLLAIACAACLGFLVGRIASRT